MSKATSQTSGGKASRKLPDIQLPRASVIWVLSELGLSGATKRRTFVEYIKSLRKLGIPFAPGEVGLSGRGGANYSYCHLMELALVLTLRVYNAVPDSVLSGIVSHRRSLYRHYQSAYFERTSGRGSAIVIEIPGHGVIKMEGVYLDLKLNFSGGRFVSLGPPKIISPTEAVRRFAENETAARAFLPIKLSNLAERVVALALRAPISRRGPRPRR